MEEAKQREATRSPRAAELSLLRVWSDLREDVKCDDGADLQTCPAVAPIPPLAEVLDAP